MSARKDNRAATLLESGLRSFQAGQVEQARQCGERALELAPRNPDAMHLLGIIALQRADHAAAVDILQRAVAIRSDDPAYHCNLAYGYVGLKRLPEALAAFERAARLDSGDPELQLGIGNCLAMMGKPAEAEAVLRRLVARHPGQALAWFNLANAVNDQKRYGEARDLYLRVIQLAPRFAEAHCNLGVAVHKLERFEEAEQAFRVALTHSPNFVPARVSLAITLNSLRRHAEAEAMCREALAREPERQNVWPVLGKALTGQKRWQEALQCHERAVRDYPDSSDAWGDLGEALAHAGRMREALAVLDRACALENVSSFARFFRATTLFAAGRIADGAAEYMGRQERSTFIAQHPERPLAERLPRDLQGREVGIVGEQGLGDEVFFLRYAPLLKLRGCRLAYCGNPKITGILARNAVFERVSSNLGSVAAADYGVLVGDLPHLLAGSGMSQHAPLTLTSGMGDTAAGLAARFSEHCRLYWPELPPPLELAPLPERAAAAVERLRQLGDPPYLGLTWRSGTGAGEQRGQVWFLFKEIALEHLAGALRGVEGTLLSLQRRPGAGETDRLSALVGRRVHDLSAANDDLEEMLALLAALDEYVCVSNTNTHLRASAGKTARVLVPWPADWRWMASGGESPWFPGFSVYRQKPDGDWSAALDGLADDLAARRSARSDGPPIAKPPGDSA